MKKLLYILLLTLAQNISAQHLFQKTYGNLLDDWFWDLEVVNDTDIYVVGYTREYNPNHNTILFSRLNIYGDVQWSKSINIGDGDASYNIVQLSNNTLLLTGETWDYIPPGDLDMLLINIDSSGNILWKKNWGTSTNDRLDVSFETADNFIVSIGYITYFIPYTWGGLKIVKSDLSGNIIWDKTKLFDDSAFPIDVKRIHDNKYIISGSTSPLRLNNSYDNMLLAEMDSSGNINWAKGYGGFQEEYSANLVLTDSGGVISATTSFSYDTSGFSDIIVIRTDSSGNILWSKKFGGSKNEVLRGMLRDTSGNYLLYGSCGSFYPAFTGTGLVFKIDDSGDLIWSHLYGTNSASIFFDMNQVHDQLLVIGQTRSPIFPANLDGVLIKTNWDGISGCVDTTIVLPHEDIIVNSYNVSFRDTVQNYTVNFSYSDTSLSINTNVLCDTILGTEENRMHKNFTLYPNPNSGIFFIRISEFEKIKKIEIRNVFGQQVPFDKQIINGNIYVNMNGAASGLYFINLIAEKSKYTLKTIIH